MRKGRWIAMALLLLVMAGVMTNILPGFHTANAKADVACELSLYRTQARADVEDSYYGAHIWLHAHWCFNMEPGKVRVSKFWISKGEVVLSWGWEQMGRVEQQTDYKSHWPHFVSKKVWVQVEQCAAGICNSHTIWIQLWLKPGYYIARCSGYVPDHKSGCDVGGTGGA